MIRVLTSIDGLQTRSGGTDLGTLALMLASLLCAIAVIKLSAFGNLSLPRAHVTLPLCLISMSGTNCSISNAIARTSFPKLEFDRAVQPRCYVDLHLLTIYFAKHYIATSNRA